MSQMQYADCRLLEIKSVESIRSYQSETMVNLDRAIYPGNHDDFLSYSWQFTIQEGNWR